MSQDVKQLLSALREVLRVKNAAYGDAALNPIRLFSSLDATEQLKVRMDDKVSRIVRGRNTERVPEDVALDLAGYVVLLLMNDKSPGVCDFNFDLNCEIAAIASETDVFPVTRDISKPHRLIQRVKEITSRELNRSELRRFVIELLLVHGKETATKPEWVLIHAVIDELKEARRQLKEVQARCTQLVEDERERRRYVKQVS